MGNQIDKSIEFAKENLALIRGFIRKDPAYILAAGNSAVPYQSLISDILSNDGYDIIPGTLTFEDDEIHGFVENHLKGRKVVIITKNPRDEGSLYAPKIAEKYRELKDEYKPIDAIFITAEPFSRKRLENFLYK